MVLERSVAGWHRIDRSYPIIRSVLSKRATGRGESQRLGSGSAVYIPLQI